MASVTIHNDFGAQENKICHFFYFFPVYLRWSDGTACHDLKFFWMLNFKPGFSLSSFTLIERLFSSSELSATRVVSSNLRLLILSPAILIPACDSFSPAFHMMYSALKLNKQGDNTQLWHTPFPILNQAGSNRCFLTHIQVTQITAKVVQYSHLFKNFPQCVVIHTVKGFSIVNKADVFLEFPYFLYDPTNVGNLISGSSAFSKSKFTSWSSQFTYCCSLAWKILSITLLAFQLSTVVL